MPSIGSANTSTAFGATAAGGRSRPEIATAIEKPGALPATPMMIDSKKDRESAFSSVLIDAEASVTDRSRIPPAIISRNKRRAFLAFQFAEQVEEIAAAGSRRAGAEWRMRSSDASKPSGKSPRARTPSTRPYRGRVRRQPCADPVQHRRSIAAITGAGSHRRRRLGVRRAAPGPRAAGTRNATLRLL